MGTETGRKKAGRVGVVRESQGAAEEHGDEGGREPRAGGPSCKALLEVALLGVEVLSDVLLVVVLVKVGVALLDALSNAKMH